MALTLERPDFSATLDWPYDSQFTASGGTAPYTFLVLSGGFPTGLTLDLSTGALTGTPTVASEFVSYSVQVTDSLAASTSRSGSITVTDIPAPTPPTTDVIPYLVGTDPRFVGQWSLWDGDGLRGPNIQIPPFEFGGKIYCAYTNIAPSPINPFPSFPIAGDFLAMSSSTDGQTFTVLDADNAPETSHLAMPYTVLDLANNRVLFFYDDLSRLLTVGVFNLTTGLWDTPFAVSGPSVGAGSQNWGPFITATQIDSTTFEVCYMFFSNSSAGNSLRCVQVVAGTWGSPADIVTSTSALGPLMSGACIHPSSGTTFVFYQVYKTDSPQTLNLYYAPIDNTGAIGTPVLITGKSGNTGAGFYSSVPKYVAATDEIKFPTFTLQPINFTPAPPNTWFLVNIADPAGARTVTLEGIGDGDLTDDVIGSPYFFTNPDESRYYVAVEVKQGQNESLGPIGNGFENILLYQKAPADPSWSGPTVFYSAQTHPPPGPSYANTADVISFTPPAELNSIAFTVLSTGAIAGTVGMLSGVCDVEFFVSESLTPTTQTLELTKIVSGGPAVPGDWTLTGTGGSPETSITGDGHVGPSEVSPGTFELEESGGPGAVWGEGVWGSAIWGGDYAPGAWDCGDAEMPTPTSVIVPEGGVVACQIVNTFIPTPPPPPPSGGTLNAVGCWELLRLDVTLTPSRHLPTRGSVR